MNDLTGKRICVFCASSDSVAQVYYKVAENLGKLIALNNAILIYGGTTVGMMHAVNESVKINGGKSIGVIPELIQSKGIASVNVDFSILTKDMNERKSIMVNNSDVFIALPGGFGTIEEIFEVITKKQLGYHNKPIIFVNTNSFYDELFNFLENLYKQQFAKITYKRLFVKLDDLNEVFSYLKSYKPEVMEDKWFKKQ